ncbi:SHOCT domain-containing protein [Rhodococcus jostii]|jgi:putative membrane protein|uniref:SHOCT domain-containing protein n=1 Tax=Rhodococcus jostii TaxID=132919 RepID=UPI00365C9F5D
MYDDDVGGWGYALMFTGMALIWGLLIVGIILLIRYASHPFPAPPGGPPHRSAEAVLAERFARGEIDEQEYRNRLSILRAGTTP